MSTREHDSELLGAYVLGALDEREVRAVDLHTASCQKCHDELDGLREMESALGEVPPEAFLDGPPEGGDLLLQRTLRQVRDEGAGQTLRRRAVLGAVAAVAAAAVLGSGVLIGQNTGEHSPVAAPPTPSVTATPPPPAKPTGVTIREGRSASTGTEIRLRVTPAADWIRLNTSVVGIPAGERCRLVVIAKDGSREIAGSWLVGDETKGSNLDGSAAVPMDDVEKVVIENDKGKEYVSVDV
ncbi:zf-HC2 domain-containing protein [Streptomyces sp. C11-1]|uniref:Zf-HC2 domain-containing protein n=1 Tax=Streptomyces durocortorensis TaxID=2811104 RepID=A0ABY9W6J7_9ACTN|nr:zf-HC2 domain-containing protein [Streptomyces durocortorensis]WNF30696.1 zf-HC2 domain-containing protein [Streptomyces durocortorensis]